MTQQATDDLVWYVCYGSNLWWSRFRVYLEGGIAPGGSRHQPGARDTTPPRDSKPCFLDYDLYFGDSSRTWGGGGVAYLDTASEGAATRARRYLITADQFADVLAQEGGRDPAESPPVVLPAAGHSVKVGRGWYDLLLNLGPVDGWPMVTFTTSRARSEVDENPPSAAYLNTIVNGLVEGHDLTAEQARYHLGVTAR